MRLLTRCLIASALIPTVTFAAGMNDGVDRHIQKDDRDTVEEVRVFHIILRDSSAAENLRKKLLAVPAKRLFEEFKRAARSLSFDKGSSSKGGDLGVVREGELERSFDDAMLAQPIETVSSPIQTNFGWHLIYVASRTKLHVEKVCDNAILKSIEDGSKNDVAALKFSIKATQASDIHPAVLQIIGEDWNASLIDGGGNLIYLKLDKERKAERTVHLQMHTEYIHPLYNSSPLACRRSARQTFEIDCERSLIKPILIQEFEGRGGAGRKLVDQSFDDMPRVQATSGFYKQLVAKACPI